MEQNKTYTKDFNSLSLFTQTKKGEQVVAMTLSTKKASKLTDVDIVELSTER